MTLLREKGINVGNVFVTVDPVRDTPEVMAEFTSWFDDAMLGLTGSSDDVSEMARQFRVYYAQNGSGDDYLMDHSTLTYLMMPEDGLAEVFRRDMPAEVLAEKIGCFVELM